MFKKIKDCIVKKYFYEQFSEKEKTKKEFVQYYFTEKDAKNLLELSKTIEGFHRMPKK